MKFGSCRRPSSAQDGCLPSCPKVALEGNLSLSRDSLPRPTDDARQHAPQRCAVARGQVRALSPRGRDQCRRLRRGRCCAVLRSAHGVHLLRHHRRRRAAQLERAATAREPDRLAVAMKEIVREESDGLALPDNIHSWHSSSQLVDRCGCRRRSTFAHLRLALSKSDRRKWRSRPRDSGAGADRDRLPSVDHGRPSSYPPLACQF